MSQGIRSRLAVSARPAGDPHCEQKRAAGEIWLPQLAHLANSADAPQAEQNLPLSAAPHTLQD
jgi:hypothetical protein